MIWRSIRLSKHVQSWSLSISKPAPPAALLIWLNGITILPSSFSSKNLGVILDSSFFLSYIQLESEIPVDSSFKTYQHPTTFHHFQYYLTSLSHHQSLSLGLQYPIRTPCFNLCFLHTLWPQQRRKSNSFKIKMSVISHLSIWNLPKTLRIRAYVLTKSHTLCLYLPLTYPTTYHTILLPFHPPPVHPH